MPHVLQIVASLAIAASSLASQESLPTKHVSLVIGCVELPTSYRVVWSGGEVDFFAGYFEPPEKNWRMTWHAGMWQSFLDPNEGRRVLWTRTDTMDSETVTVGEIEESGLSLIVVSRGLFELALPAKVSNAEELLKAILARYRTDCHGLDVIPPERI